MKKLAAFVVILMAALLFSLPVNAAQDYGREIFDEQLRESGADALYSSLPEQTRELLSELGIYEISEDRMPGADFADILGKTGELAAKKGSAPLAAAAVCIGILLLGSVTGGSQQSALAGVGNAVGALCIYCIIITPLCSLISSVGEVISAITGFSAMYIPVMAGLLACGGHEGSASSYYTLLMGASQIITQLSAKFVIPMINVFTVLSVSASLSCEVKMSSLCSAVYKTVKWVLTFVMSIFATVLTTQTFAASSMDRVSKRALSFTVSSFVPAVGGVLSETLGAFTGSLEMLRSGAGVFIIIACGCIVLPVLIECILWRAVLTVLAAAGETFGTERMKTVFTMLSDAVGMLTAVLLCVLSVFIISTVIILIAGK